jgi:hypothetical protein
MNVKVRVRHVPPNPALDKTEAWLRSSRGRVALEQLELALLEQVEHLLPLTPSPAGRECLGNGTWPGYPCQCPGCDWYETVCFPESAADDD